MSSRAGPSAGPLEAQSGRGNRRLRRLDETAGVVLVRLLGFRRRARSRPAAPRRIGLMKTTGIGDMVLLSGLITDVTAAYPAAQLVVFAGPANGSLADLLPDVKVVRLPIARPQAALSLLRSERLDVLLDFGQWTRLEAVLTGLSGARFTAGFATAGQRRHLGYDVSVEHSAHLPEMDNLRRLTAVALGVAATTDPHFAPSAQKQLPFPLPAPYTVLHMWPGGYRSELREWAAERWRELARLLVERGQSLVLTGGPADVGRTDAFLSECEIDLRDRTVSLAGRATLAELVDVLASAQAVISVNTGVMHLAAAVGAPTVALNGPTSSLRWGPIGADVTSIDSDLPGCGYLNLGFEYEGQRLDCMAGISVDRVAAAVLERARA